MGKRNIPDDWFIDDERVSFDKTVSKRMGGWWMDKIYQPHTITPRQFGEMLIADLPSESSAKFLTFSRKKDSVSLELIGVAGNSIVYLAGHTMTLASNDENLNVDLLAVDAGYQGAGVGSRLMGNLYNVALALGVDKIKLRAALDAGPYVWARFGFLPTDSEWKRVKRKIWDKLDGLGAMVSPEARSRVEDALGATSGRAIAVIAEEAEIVMSRPHPSIDAPPRDVPLGLALLADSGIQWYGALDLNDDAAVAIFEGRLQQNAGWERK